MGQPITWRTIMGPSPAEAIRGLELAQRSINAGFGNFTNAFNQAEDRNTTILNTEKAANLLGLKNVLKEKYTTPEAYQQAVASGEVANLVNQYGSKISGEAAAQFTDNRLKELRTGVLDNINYTDKTTEAAQRSVVESLRARLFAGDKTAMADAEKLGIRGIDKLAETGYNIGNNAFDQSIKGATLGINAAKLGMDQQTLPYQINQMRASTNAANAGVKLSRDIFNMNKADKEADNALRLAEFLSGDKANGSSSSTAKAGANKLSEENMFSLGVIGTPSGDEALRKALLVDRKMPMNVYNDVVAQNWGGIKNKDGTPAKVPVGSILSAIDRNPDFFSGSLWSRFGDSAHSEMQNVFNSNNAASQAELERINKDFAAYLESIAPASNVPNTRNLDALNAALGYTKGKGKKLDIPK